MKDPLQTLQTPYEILGVESDASKADIKLALTNAIRNKMDWNMAKTAFDDIQSPRKRAMFDLLQYNPQILSAHLENGKDPKEFLSPGQRAKTAMQWEEALRGRFPDSGLVHCLSVLWYWWTLYEEERLDRMAESTKGKIPISGRCAVSCTNRYLIPISTSPGPKVLGPPGGKAAAAGTTK